MQEGFIKENVKFTKVEADRRLRAYRKLKGAFRRMRTSEQDIEDFDFSDETSVLAELYSLREIILSVEDSEQRTFLYFYYIKGYTLEKCAKQLEISIRSVYRLKNRALENVSRIIKLRND